MTYGGFSGDFKSLSVDGTPCSAHGLDVWACNVGFFLSLDYGGDVLALSVARIPEPSTWAMMLLGFAALGVAGYRASRRSLAVAA